MQPFVGLSWTRPVPWRTFQRLSPDIDVAAQQSRTIRYQRDRIRRHVKTEGGTLISEIALIEIAPDRATPDGMAALAKVVAAQPKDAIFAYVDFAACFGWRTNRFLSEALRGSRTHPLYPDPLVIDGAEFDPINHFRIWRERDQDHIKAKADHARQVMTVLAADPGRSLAQSAAALNEMGLATHGGKPWSADNLRKFRKLHAQVIADQ